MVEKIIKIKQSKEFGNVGSMTLEIILDRKLICPNINTNMITMISSHPSNLDSLNRWISMCLTNKQLLELADKIKTHVGKS